MDMMQQGLMKLKLLLVPLAQSKEIQKNLVLIFLKCINNSLFAKTRFRNYSVDLMEKKN